MLPDYYKTYDLQKSMVELQEEMEGCPSRLMTIWIPFDRELNDLDETNVKKLGELLKPLLKPFRVSHCTTSYSTDKIGLVIAGLVLNEDARQAIIPTLKRCCPQQTIFSIEEITEESDDIEVTEMPLFETGEKALCETFILP